MDFSRDSGVESAATASTCPREVWTSHVALEWSSVATAWTCPREVWTSHVTLEWSLRLLHGRVLGRYGQSCIAGRGLEYLEECRCEQSCIAGRGLEDLEEWRCGQSCIAGRGLEEEGMAPDVITMGEVWHFGRGKLRRQ